MKTAFNEKTQLIGHKKLLQFNVYVGTLVGDRVQEKLMEFKLKNTLEDYADIVCVYTPIIEERDYDQIIRII